MSSLAQRPVFLLNVAPMENPGICKLLALTIPDVLVELALPAQQDKR
jgi:hypothetical protein